MTQSPAGWYPDPDPNHVGAPGRLRYWDGAAWTEHVHEPQAPVAPQPPVQGSAQPPAYPDLTKPAAQESPDGGFAPIGGGTPEQQGYQQGYQPVPAYPTGQQPPYGQSSYQQPPYGQSPYAGGYDTGRDTTPDGAPLASWGRRVGARLLDWLISLPLLLLLLAPLFAAQWDSLEQWIDDLDYATTYGTADPPAPPIFDFTTGPGLLLLAIFMLTPLLYDIVFLLWKQATPGKLILGLRVRLRERPELPAGAVFGRVGTTFALNICWIGSLLDVLWPLWDDKKQALHDKAAKTNVVKVR